MSEQAGTTVASVVVTPSTHLANFLATCGCEIQHVVTGPERTPDGRPVVKWVFQDTRTAEEIMVGWKNPPKDAPDWEHLTPRERDIVINMVTAFSDNLHHFIRIAKNGGVS